MHHAHQRVHLRAVAAVGAELLPDIRDRVQTDHVHALIGEEEEVLRHVVEHDGVAVVEIPLIGIEEGHHDLAAVVEPGEVARRRRGEDLRHRALILERKVPVVEEEVAASRHRVARSRGARPGMILARVVHHEVEADAHVLLVAELGELVQLLHLAELRLHLAEIRHGVAAVAPLRHGLEKRHQMQVVHAAVLNVVELLHHAIEVAGEVVDVQHHAEELVRAVPVGVLLPLFVQRAQGLAPRVIAPAEHVAEVFKRGLIVLIKLAVEPFQLVIALSQALFHLLSHVLLSLPGDFPVFQTRRAAAARSHSTAATVRTAPAPAGRCGKSGSRAARRPA